MYYIPAACTCILPIAVWALIMCCLRCCVACEDTELSQIVTKEQAEAQKASQQAKLMPKPKPKIIAMKKSAAKSKAHAKATAKPPKIKRKGCAYARDAAGGLRCNKRGVSHMPRSFFSLVCRCSPSRCGNLVGGTFASGNNQSETNHLITPRAESDYSPSSGHVVRGMPFETYTIVRIWVHLICYVSPVRSLRAIIAGKTIVAPDSIEEGATFVEVVRQFKAYLLKIDPNCQHVNEYGQLLFFAQVKGQIAIDGSGPKDKIVKRFSSLRKMIKTQVYMAARLQPRKTDIDFEEDEQLEPAVKPIEAWSAEECTESLVEFQLSAYALKSFLEQNNPRVVLCPRCRSIKLFCG